MNSYLANRSNYLRSFSSNFHLKTKNIVLRHENKRKFSFTCLDDLTYVQVYLVNLLRHYLTIWNINFNIANTQMYSLLIIHFCVEFLSRNKIPLNNSHQVKRYEFSWILHKTQVLGIMRSDKLLGRNETSLHCVCSQLTCPHSLYISLWVQTSSLMP